MSGSDLNYLQLMQQGRWYPNEHKSLERNINSAVRDMKLIPLSELYSERKYYREFHHKILSLFNTIYLSAMVGQTIASSQLSNASCMVIYTLIAVLIGILPIYTTYIYLRYHLVIEGLNRAIKSTLQNIQNNKASDASNVAIKWHIGNADKVEKKAIFSGQGHWYFIITMWLLVAINGVLLLRHL